MSIAPLLHFLRRWNTNGIEEEHIAFIRIPFFNGPCQRGLATPGSARQNNKRTCHSLIISSAASGFPFSFGDIRATHISSASQGHCGRIKFAYSWKPTVWNQSMDTPIFWVAIR
jgi:hypothetical protein